MKYLISLFALLPSVLFAGGVLVQFDSSKSSLLADLKSEQNTKIRKISTLIPNLYHIQSEFRSDKFLLDNLLAQKDTKRGELNHKISILPTKIGKALQCKKRALVSEEGFPNDPYFNEQWALYQEENDEASPFRKDLGALEAWKITKGSKKIKIAVIDTGVDYNHKELKANMWVNEVELNGKTGVDDDNNGYIDDIHGYNTVEHNGDPMDDNGHGTHCAGIIGAVQNNGLGISGIMPEVTLVAVKFLGASGGGEDSNAIEAIEYAIKAGVDIMSNSWGSSQGSIFLKEIVQKAQESGIYFVVAAGNNADDTDSYPMYPSVYAKDLNNVFSVASHTPNLSLSYFSNYGNESVTIAAPGDNILSTTPNDMVMTMSGTSMAAPYVAGIIGLLISHEGSLPFDELQQRFLDNSVPSRNFKRIMTEGRIHAEALLTKFVPPRPDDSAWKDYELDEPFESVHPMPRGAWITKQIKIPGARFIRVIVEKFDLEDGFDFFKIKEGGQSVHRIVIDELTGAGENYTTEYLDGDSIELIISSTYVPSRTWGVKILKLQYIK